MSRLKELIDELCPDGAEYRQISELYTKLRGTPITAATMKKIANDDGDTIIFAGGKTVVRANESDIPKVNVIRRPSVVVQSRGVIDFIYCDEPFTFKNEMWAYTCDDTVSVKFLYYALKSNVDRFRVLASAMSSLPQIAARDTEEHRIPVPPIEVQREIVRILDSFQELDDTLTAEIEAREKQRSFTIERILSRSYIEAVQGTKADELRLCEIADVGSSKRVLKRDLIDEGIPFFRGTEVAQLAEHKPINPQLYLSEELYGSISASYGVPQKGDLLLPSVNPSGLVWMVDVDYPFYLKDARVLWVHTSSADVDCRYMRYALSKSIEDNFRFIASGSQFAELKISSLSDTPILLPKKEVQSLIADKLDLVTKLAHVVVPCERDTRRKQFAHYRDKLLAFPKKEI